MNLIALRSFRNVRSLRLRGKDQKSSVEGSLHDDHVHKGATFAMGEAKTLKELVEEDRDTAVQVANLIASGCVGLADDKDVVAAVKAELAMEAKREENAKKMDVQGSNIALAQQLTAALASHHAKAK